MSGRPCQWLGAYLLPVAADCGSSTPVHVPLCDWPTDRLTRTWCQSNSQAVQRRHGGLDQPPCDGGPCPSAGCSNRLPPVRYLQAARVGPWRSHSGLSFQRRSGFGLTKAGPAVSIQSPPVLRCEEFCEPALVSGVPQPRNRPSPVTSERPRTSLPSSRRRFPPGRSTSQRRPVKHWRPPTHGRGFAPPPG